jgi:hypothetical protein
MASKEETRPTNASVVASVKRLVEMLKNDENGEKSAPHLSHYRGLPSDVKKSYELLHQGAQLVHSTATKYTLIGNIDGNEQKILGADLLRGCEIIGAATHILLQDASGCSRAVRRSAVRASLAISINVIRLAESFEDHTALDKNVGAQKTGAVWESCDTILNKRLPQGNRNAIRRELFTWTRDCQDTLEEFQELIDLGPGETGSGDAVEEEDEDLFDDDEQYPEAELPIAKACLGLLKCSRGTMKVTLETCEDLGSKATETQDEKYLDWIAQLHEHAQEVGEGLTDLGSLMYPPLLPSTSDLESQVRKQGGAMIKLHDFVLGMERLPEQVSELVNVLRNAAETRQKEFLNAIAEAKQ